MLLGAEMDVIVQAVRTAAKAAVVPRFRALEEADVSQKRDFADLVTVADTEAEAMMGALLAQSWPEARVLGEEAVAANPSLRAAMAGRGWQVIVDPVDGTWNFAKGLACFGMIAVAVKDGVPVYGLLYDPLLDDWVEAQADGAARFVRSDGAATVLRVSGKPIRRRCAAMFRWGCLTRSGGGRRCWRAWAMGASRPCAVRAMNTGCWRRGMWSL